MYQENSRYWPTGFADLDRALGRPGYPAGRLIEVQGADRHQVTVAALTACITAGGVAALVDPVHVFRPEHWDGAHLGRLLVSQPEDQAQCWDIVNTLAKSGAVDMIALTGSFLPSSDKFYRHLTPVLYRVGCTMLVESDKGMALDVRDLEATSLRFYSSVRLLVERRNGVLAAKVLKNKMAAPFETACLGEAP